MMRQPKSVRTFAQDEGGTILVFWAVALGVVLGFVALSFDLGRAGITRSELQSFADSVALAAAGELDGNNDALTRATNAATLVVDSQSYGNTERLLSGPASYTLTFFRTLPPDDETAMADETTDPWDAAFVRVDVTPTVVVSTFGAAFAALTDQTNRNYDLGANAVAGLSMYACDIQPMMFCLPSEHYHAEDHIGDMIHLRAGGPGAAWAPGDFGFLDPREIMADPSGPCARLNGAPLLRCLLGAVDNITQCFNQRGVDIEPGQKAGLENSIFNIRFDIYNQAMGRPQYSNSAAYAPAPNVIKGIIPVVNGNGSGGPNACIGNSPADSPDTEPLPLDDCFPGCGRFGDGNWSSGRVVYETANYGAPVPSRASISTRYEYYLDEIASSGGGPILAGRSETGLPTCNRNSAPPDRRVITVAAIDCLENDIHGAANNVPVREFFEIFLLQPVSQDMDIYGEIIGSASDSGTGASGSGGIVRDVVQLFR